MRWKKARTAEKQCWGTEGLKRGTHPGLVQESLTLLAQDGNENVAGFGFLVCLFALIADHCINTGSLHSVLKGRDGLLYSFWSVFQHRVQNKCRSRRAAQCHLPKDRQLLFFLYEPLTLSEVWHEIVTKGYFISL